MFDLNKSKYKDIDKDNLYNLFITQNLAAKEISKLLNIPETCLLRILQYFNFKKTPEQIKELHIRLANEKYARRTEEKRLQKSRKIKEWWANKTKEQKEKDMQGLLRVNKNRSPEHRAKLAASYKKFIANETPEEKEERIRKVSEGTKKGMQNMSEEQKGVMLKKRQKSIKNRTVEQKAKTTQKYKETWAAKSKDEIKNIKSKGVETRKKNNIEKYGTEHVPMPEETKLKIRKTNLKRYGTEYPSKLQEFKNKRQQTCIKKYGTPNPNSLPEIQEKTKKTCLERYGFEKPQLSPIVQEKAKQTCIKRYGISNPMILPEIQEKIKRTLDKNNTWSYSKPELHIRFLLILLYPNTKYQYRSKEYPFNCDFYIPELDLYIEYQGHQGHGKSIYDSTNQTHINLINKWEKRAFEIESRTGKRSKYRDYIKTWTIRDPLKRETAKKNNLNWLEFFTMDEFMNWYKKQSGIPLLEYKSSI